MERIEIGGTEYPLKYGRKALLQVLALVNAKSLKEADKMSAMKPADWGKMIHYGLETGCKIEDMEPPTLEDVDDAVDLDLSLWSTALRQLQADMSSGKTADEGN